MESPVKKRKLTEKGGAYRAAVLKERRDKIDTAMTKTCSYDLCN